MTAIATTDDVVSLAPSEVEYARLLYASGYGSWRIADLLGCDRRLIDNLVQYRGWVHRTPCRFSAPIGWRRPVLVRCAVCAGRFGEELGQPRPCPHCGSSERRGAAHG